MPLPLPASDSARGLLTRRGLLQLGGVGVLGLGLPELLRAGAPIATGRSGPERSCIFIVQYGGASHIDSLDPKPDAPEAMRGPYKPIADTCSRRSSRRTAAAPGGIGRPVLSDSLDEPPQRRPRRRHARVHDRTFAARGEYSLLWLRHGENAADTPQSAVVCLDAKSGRRRAAALPDWRLPRRGLQSAARRHRSGQSLGHQGFRLTAFDPPPDVPAERLRRRRGLLASVEPEDGPLARTASSESMRRFQERAVDLVTGPEARRAFDLEREPVGVRDRYGRGPLGQNLLLARRLIEAGVRLVSVTAWAGLPSGEKFRNVQTWDMHGNGAGLGSIFGTGHFGLGWALPRVDESVSALLEDLRDRGLLDSTLVVMVGEFGRSPKVVKEGRDHWPACYSALVAGAGIRGGTVYGASDKIGGYGARQSGVAGGLRRDAVSRPGCAAGDAPGSGRLHASGKCRQTDFEFV